MEFQIDSREKGGGGQTSANRESKPDRVSPNLRESNDIFFSDFLSCSPPSAPFCAKV